MDDQETTVDPVKWAREFARRFNWVPLTPSIRDELIEWFSHALNEAYTQGYQQSIEDNH